MSATEILEQIRRLPPKERNEIAEKVWEEFGDFDDELTPEQAAELDRRVAEFKENPHDGIPWEQVQAEAKQRFGWK
jgi:putative addiction module component (TIGR02574 family)